MIKIGEKYVLQNQVYGQGVIVTVVDNHGYNNSYTVVDEDGNGYLVQERNLGKIKWVEDGELEFPNITHKEITGIEYRKNEIILSIEGEELVFGADKDGNLLINGIPKKEFKTLNNR